MARMYLDTAKIARFRLTVIRLGACFRLDMPSVHGQRGALTSFWPPGTICCSLSSFRAVDGLMYHDSASTVRFALTVMGLGGWSLLHMPSVHGQK
jgi:hypothetical protein